MSPPLRSTPCPPTYRPNPFSPRMTEYEILIKKYLTESACKMRGRYRTLRRRYVKYVRLMGVV